MAIIKKTELNKMDGKTLETKLIDLKKELVKINIQISTGTLPENPGRVKEIKKTIARIYPLLKKSQIPKTTREEKNKQG